MANRSDNEEGSCFILKCNETLCSTLESLLGVLCILSRLIFRQYCMSFKLHICTQLHNVSQNPYHVENVQSLVLQVIINMSQWHVQRCCQHPKLGCLADKCVWVKKKKKTQLVFMQFTSESIRSSSEDKKISLSKIFHESSHSSVSRLTLKYS